jgi:MSHA pilin protein MshD
LTVAAAKFVPKNAQRGVTLIELIVSIVIVAIAAAAVLGVLAMNTAASADPMLRHQASAIAEAYLEEILLRSFSDPDGVDGEGSRAAFDDLDDYDGLTDVGARDQFGNAIAGLDAYTVSVTVSNSSALPSVPAGDALRVDVLVSRGAGINLVLSGYRTRF